MRDIVVADTSILIIFEKIQHYHILRELYGKLWITPEIADEYNTELPHWIKVKAPVDKKYQELLTLQLDEGEASAIALAKECSNALLLVDDLKARKVAQHVSLKITGTLGIIHRAKQSGLVAEIKPLIENILATDFRISQRVVAELLAINNESALESGKYW